MSIKFQRLICEQIGGLNWLNGFEGFAVWYWMNVVFAAKRINAHLIFCDLPHPFDGAADLFSLVQPELYGLSSNRFSA